VTAFCHHHKLPTQCANDEVSTSETSVSFHENRARYIPDDCRCGNLNLVVNILSRKIIFVMTSENAARTHIVLQAQTTSCRKVSALLVSAVGSSCESGAEGGSGFSGLIRAPSRLMRAGSVVTAVTALKGAITVFNVDDHQSCVLR
jgi:hypothetical protein